MSIDLFSIVENQPDNRNELISDKFVSSNNMQIKSEDKIQYEINKHNIKIEKEMAISLPKAYSREEILKSSTEYFSGDS
ncbi:MAG: hypothetical protein WCQ30_07760, partial [Bacteroidales bacterium]